MLEIANCTLNEWVYEERVLWLPLSVLCESDNQYFSGKISHKYKYKNEYVNYWYPVNYIMSKQLLWWPVTLCQDHPM